LKRNMKAWRGWSAARESASREYKSSTMRGTPSVFNNSLKKIGWTKNRRVTENYT
jgi:hypothetical protein